MHTTQLHTAASRTSQHQKEIHARWQVGDFSSALVSLGYQPWSVKCIGDRALTDSSVNLAIEDVVDSAPSAPRKECEDEKLAHI